MATECLTTLAYSNNRQEVSTIHLLIISTGTQRHLAIAGLLLPINASPYCDRVLVPLVTGRELRRRAACGRLSGVADHVRIEALRHGGRNDDGRSAVQV